MSVDRKELSGRRRTSPGPVYLEKLSAPTVCSFTDDSPSSPPHNQFPNTLTQNTGFDTRTSLVSGTGRAPTNGLFPDESFTSLQQYSSNGEQRDPPQAQFGDELPQDQSLADAVDDDFRDELDERWILNLSMHFRDKSPREKFFVTYAETPNMWRRITVSVDYRNAPPDSLERDLQGHVYQRDKSARIYESIRTSLPDIQFYDTVTNLRLETSEDDRLHVHVTEDVNEIIPYPSSSLLEHIQNVPRYAESDVHFQSHMSGFVYKVQVDDEILIKKEIPGPDSVEEFLYEINALYQLRGTHNVVQFKGIVVDEQLDLVKGILIAYAERGPLVDIIYDDKGFLAWERRERWAKEIVQGLCEIHEAGFVQGDFTLSNIVIDESDTAIIIDINRRGCPVGWEPPEIAAMIASGQRISMYIGVKSDLFQLGMVLWALANETDEPERQDRPLTRLEHPIPEYYRDVVATCLSQEPKKRSSAKSLLARFPQIDSEPLESLLTMGNSHIIHATHSQPEYIDPATAVGREDIEDSRSRGPPSRTASASHRFWDSNTYYEGRPSSTDMPFDSSSSCIVPRRGRSPPANTAHLAPSQIRRTSSNAQSPSEVSYAPQILPVSPSDEHKWEELVGADGRTFLVEADENPEERQARLRRSQERMQQSMDEAVMTARFEHVDSGLGDMIGGLSREGTDMEMSGHRFRRQHTTGMRSMEHVDSGLGDMDPAGLGDDDSLQEYMRKDLFLDDGMLGGASPGGGGHDLVTVDEHEVVEDFRGDEQQASRDRIGAVDMAFSGGRQVWSDSKAHDVDTPKVTNQHDRQATQDIRASLP